MKYRCVTMTTEEEMEAIATQEGGSLVTTLATQNNMANVTSIRRRTECTLAMWCTHADNTCRFDGKNKQKQTTFRQCCSQNLSVCVSNVISHFSQIYIKMILHIMVMCCLLSSSQYLNLFTATWRHLPLCVSIKLARARRSITRFCVCSTVNVNWEVSINSLKQVLVDPF